MAKKKGTDDKKKTDKKKGSNPDVKTRREKQLVPIKLTNEEKAKISEQHVETLDKITAKEKEKKTADDAIKTDIGLLEEVAAKLASMIRSGTEERNVEVDVEHDWLHKEIRVVLVSTGEVLSRRTMTFEESQKEMFDLKAKAEKEKNKGKLIAFEGGKGKADEDACGECKGTGNITMGEPPLPVKCGECMGSGKAPVKTARLRPVTNDVIDVETIAGWKRGKVLPSNGSVLNVECSDGKIEHAPLDGQTWRWPDEVGEQSSPVVEGKPNPLKASVGEIDKAKKKGKGRKNSKSKSAEDEYVPGPDEAF